MNSSCKSCSQGKVNVIGAGVIGLTTALLLRQKGYSVTIIANHFPGDSDIEYTSPCAGARWRTVAPNSDLRLQHYDAVSFKTFWELAKSHAAETGIMIVSAYDYYEHVTDDTKNPWFKGLVPTFQFIDKSELPKDIAIGYHYATVLVNPLVYLPWLLKQYLLLGGKHRRQKINCISEAMDDDIDIVVNCTGVGARDLEGVNDKTVVPVRGQNVLIKAPHVRKAVYINTSKGCTYIIPRSDGTVVLGTTRDEGNCDPNVNSEVTQEILQRAYKYCPDLSLQRKGVQDLKVIKNIVGLRPSRAGGPVLKNQYYNSPSGKQTLITHNYGHGGAGYQSSWGTAQEAVRLVYEGHSVIKNKSNSIRVLLSRL
ncbi:D-amino-acid oxidase [Choanephora cucurbitarum]|uniref:D-amino-acid oxidase n=1 Tax=Choanephora cucurbitarum TaxID=101091 RepID=A0A1C7N8Y7_9FUNG|nr:D-amino-acid oxidase [Choanephora cucurbitarum]